MVSHASTLGQIITFYSYKGGTGRSMALANVACLLAQKQAIGGDVLMIDWDLEAPGLHQFFHGRFEDSRDNQDSLPEGQLGLIDLFYDLQSRLAKSQLESDDTDVIFEHLDISKYTTKLEIPLLRLMPAGRFDDKLYSSRVNTFNWESFFDKYPLIISQFANYLRKKFRYVLIDSRTGYTDTSGICTSLMPEKLVIVFTPNRQSLTGVLELVRKATDYRKQSDDLRPLIVFPLPSRIENAESKLQQDWRFGNMADGVLGYQPQFESLLKEVYSLSDCDLTKYFDEVQLQYIPRYSYGEEIAVLSERTEDRLSIARSYENCTERLIDLEHPWDILEQEESLVETEKDKTQETAELLRRPLRVFLAHASFDKSVVRELHEKLMREKWLDPWLDEEKLLPGQDWEQEISSAVINTDVLIVCLSRQAVKREGHLQRELKYALDTSLEKPEGTTLVIPIRLDNCEIPTRLMAYQCLDYFPDDKKEKAYTRLLLGLKLRAEQMAKDSLYTIKSGDTFFAIALKFNTTVEAIINENRIDNPNSISVGQVIRIPPNVMKRKRK
jgi:MinD-like ATPase involved in chromosome partitioning or flagellar assembly